MPRTCVLCGKAQSRSFTVFSFPSSAKQRAAWVQIIMETKPDLLKDKKFVQSNRLKNGVCELHFLRSEISKGKKRRLSKGVVPSLDITASQKCNAIMKSYKSVFGKSFNSFHSKVELAKEHLTSGKENDYEYGVISMESDGNGNIKDSSILPDCTIKIEIEEHDSAPSEIRQSMVDNIFEEKDDGICLCCGLQNSASSLSSVLKMGTSKQSRSVLEELSSVFDVPKERVIGFSTYLCRKCLKTIEDMMELRSSFLSLLSYLKDKFLSTSKSLETGSKIDSYLEISTSKNSSKTNQPDSMLRVSTIRRKSGRLECNERKFTCDQCKECFESVAALSCHEICHEAESMPNLSIPSSTPKCSYLSSTCIKRSCPKHAQSTLVNQKQILDCPHCGRYITSKARLDHHIFKFHGIGKGKEKSIRCKLCERGFSSKPGLRYHEWAFHKAGKTYTCEVCNRSFPFRMLYNSHKLFAHGKKSVVCEFCGEMFFTVSKLNVHVNAIHRNALTWLCKLCHEKFTTVSAYKHHVIVKHKRTLYNCSHCNSQFKRKYSLMQHLCKHNVFICQKCNDKFDSSSTFVQHLAEIHKTDISDKHNAKLNRRAGARDSSSANSSGNRSTSIAVPTSKEVQSIVINDILMASNDYENSNLQQLSFQPDTTKERDEEKSSFDALSAVEPLHFDSVDTLEIQSVTNDSIELVEDVSRINVQMLEDIHGSQRNLKSEILPSVKRQNLDSSNDLQSEFAMSSSELDCSVTTHSSQLNDEPSTSEEALKKIDMMDNLSSSKHATNDALPIVDPLLSPHLKSPTFADLPVILQPVKRSNSWTFSTPLQNPARSAVDHSSAVDSGVHEESDPPVSREIDITVPSETEETKNVHLSKPMADQVNKIDDQELPTISVDIDGKGEVHYKYVMYFEPSAEKN